MVSASMATQHAKWLETPPSSPWRAPVAVAELPAHLDLLAQRPQRLQPPGPGPHRHHDARRSGTVSRVYLPPDANCLLVGRRPLPAQPRLREPDRDRQAAPAPVARHRRGAGALRARAPRAWDWAEHRRGRGARRRARVRGRRADAWRRWRRPSCCAGSCPSCACASSTSSTSWRSSRPTSTRTACRRRASRTLFTRRAHVVFAFHGYARALHQLLHGRAEPDRFHVRGFQEQGTTTTPFDMVVLNGMSRYHLAALAVRARAAGARGAGRAGRALPAHARPPPRATSASTSRTCPRSATGPGPADVGAPAASSSSTPGPRA